MNILLGTVSTSKFDKKKSVHQQSFHFERPLAKGYQFRCLEANFP
jgi:hypothetical protein